MVTALSQQRKGRRTCKGVSLEDVIEHGVVECLAAVEGVEGLAKAPTQLPYCAQLAYTLEQRITPFACKHACYIAMPFYKLKFD